MHRWMIGWSDGWIDGSCMQALFCLEYNDGIITFGEFQRLFRKRVRPISENYPSVWLERLEKINILLRIIRRPIPGRHNSVPLEYRSKILATSITLHDEIVKKDEFSTLGNERILIIQLEIYKILKCTKLKK